MTHRSINGRDLSLKEIDVLDSDTSCHYMKSGQSACMFRISYGFQWRQYRRYIAGI